MPKNVNIGKFNLENRTQLFSCDLHDIGIGIEKHEKYQFVVVIILATKA